MIPVFWHFADFTHVPPHNIPLVVLMEVDDYTCKEVVAKYVGDNDTGGVYSCPCWIRVDTGEEIPAPDYWRYP